MVANRRRVRSRWVQKAVGAQAEVQRPTGMLEVLSSGLGDNIERCDEGCDVFWRRVSDNPVAPKMHAASGVRNGAIAPNNCFGTPNGQPQCRVGAPSRRLTSRKTFPRCPSPRVRQVTSSMRARSR